MQTNRSTEAQIIAIPRRAEGCLPVTESRREDGMSNASAYNWRTEHDGMDASVIRRMKAMEDENPRLKWMYADLSTQADSSKKLCEERQIGHLNSGRRPLRP